MRKIVLIFIVVLFSLMVTILFVVNSSVIGDYSKKETMKLLEARLEGIKLLIEDFVESRRFFSVSERKKEELLLGKMLEEAGRFLQSCNSSVANGTLSDEEAKIFAISYLKGMHIYAFTLEGLPVYPIPDSDVFDISFVKAASSKGGIHTYSSGDRERVVFWSLFKPWGWVLVLPIHFKKREDFVEDIRRKLLKRISYSYPNYHINIYDRRGRIQFYSGEIYPDDKSASPVMQKVFSKKKGKIEYIQDGRHRTKVFSFIPSIGWYIVLTAYPSKVSEEMFFSLSKMALPSLLSVTGIFLLLVLLLWRRTVSVPLFAVEKGFEELGRGNYRYLIEPSVADTEEMRDIVNGFNSMARRLFENERTRIASYQKLEVVNAELALGHDRLKRILERLNVLSKIVSATVGLHTKAEIAQTTAEILAGFERCRNISILLKDRNKLRLIGYVGDPRSRVEEIPFDRGIIGWTFTSKTLRNVPDVSKEPHYSPDDPDVKSEIACPLIDEGNCIGVIDVESDLPTFFNREDEMLLMFVARYMVVVFKRVDMVSGLSKGVDDEKFLLEILGYSIRSFSLENVVQYVCRRVTENRGYGNVSFYLRKDNKLVLSYIYGLPMPEDIHAVPRGILDVMGRGISSRCARTGEVQNVPNVLKDPDFVEGGMETKSELSVPVKIEGKVIGVFDIESTDFDAFDKEDEKFMSSVAEVVGGVLYKLLLKKELEDTVRKLEDNKRELERRTVRLRSSLQQIERYINQIELTNERIRSKEEVLKRTYIDTIRAIAKAVELKDPYMEGHADRVAWFAVEIGKSMGLDEKNLRTLLYAAVLHDIGRIAVRGKVLDKKEGLDDEEYEEVKVHPIVGSDYLKKVEYLREVANVVRHHHERWDGKGYPDRLEGEEIPLLSRIIAVADAYDAMRTDRPFRRALSEDEVLQRIKEMAGVQFDPEVVRHFCEIVKRGVV